MNTMEAGQQKTNLKLIQDVINQIGQDSELKEEDKKTIDLCVMTFSDDDGMEGWLPLSEYHGGTTRNRSNRRNFCFELNSNKLKVFVGKMILTENYIMKQ